MTTIVKHTKDWVERFVIGYNLCPFATKPFNEDRIRYLPFEGQEVEELKHTFLKEVFFLRDTPPEEVETTLIIAPAMVSAFEAYLDLLDLLQNSLEAAELDAVIQLASFHPDYQFADTDYESPENFTNRSPYPMFHLLRVESVALAVEQYPDTSRIPINNIARMRQIGTSELIKRYHEIIGKN